MGLKSLCLHGIRMDVGKINAFDAPARRNIRPYTTRATQPQRSGVTKKVLRARMGIEENLNKVDEQIKKELDNGRYPAWVQDLIEHDANPMNPMTDKEFCEEHKLHINSVYYARKKYPNYAMAVAYRRKKYMADLANYTMKILVQRAPISDVALRMALEISGAYTPTIKQQIEALDPEIKRQRVLELMGQFSKDLEDKVKGSQEKEQDEGAK